MPEAGTDTSRLSAREIFERVVGDARDEIARPASSLGVSGLLAGLSMGFSGLAVAGVLARLGADGTGDLIARLFYPVGFLAVIIGRAQLFTENTLYPVALVLDERRHLAATLRLWVIVLAANVVGVFLFALLVATTGAIPPDVERELAALGEHAADRAFGTVFWSGVIGGWIIALVAWIVSGSHWTIGQVVMIWFLTFLVGLGEFAHCIATSGEILVAVLDDAVGAGDYVAWLAWATLGNIAGGVGIVALLNWAQVKAQREG